MLEMQTTYLITVNNFKKEKDVNDISPTFSSFADATTHHSNFYSCSAGIYADAPKSQKVVILRMKIQKVLYLWDMT